MEAGPKKPTHFMKASRPSLGSDCPPFYSCALLTPVLPSFFFVFRSLRYRTTRMSRRVALLAVFAALLAAFCVSSSSSVQGDILPGYALQVSFGTPNCSGEPYFYSFENTTLGGECTVGKETLRPFVRSWCSKQDGLTVTIFKDGNCTEDSETLSFNQVIDICINTGSTSLALFCDESDFLANNVTGTENITPTPASVEFPLETINNGSFFTDPCPFDGCGDAYPTTYVYNGEGCTGEVNATYYSISYVLSHNGLDGWYALDTCYYADEPTSVGANQTIQFTCSANALTYTGYAGNCEEGSAYGTITMQANSCLHDNGVWYMTTCAISPQAPVTSPTLPPSEGPSSSPLDGPSGEDTPVTPTTPSTPATPSATPSTTPISPVKPPTSDARAISMGYALVMGVAIIMALLL